MLKLLSCSICHRAPCCCDPVVWVCFTGEAPWEPLGWALLDEAATLTPRSKEGREEGRKGGRMEEQGTGKRQGSGSICEGARENKIGEEEVGKKKKKKQKNKKKKNKLTGFLYLGKKWFYQSLLKRIDNSVPGL